MAASRPPPSGQEEPEQKLVRWLASRPQNLADQPSQTLVQAALQAARRRGGCWRSPQLCAQLVEKLGQLGGAAAEALRGAEAGDPRLRHSQQATFKAALSLLCYSIRPGDSSSSGGGEGPLEGALPRGKKVAGAGGQQAGAQLQLQLRHDVLRCLAALGDALWIPGLLAGPSEVRAADVLLQATALECLTRPVQGTERGVKALADAARGLATGIISKPLLLAEDRGCHALACRYTADLLSLVSQPKQPQVVLASVAELVSGVSQQSSMAGVSIVTRLVQTVQELAAAGGEAAQQLEACTAFTAVLAASGGPCVQAALLACGLQLLLALLQDARASTRRAALESLAALLPHPCSPQHHPATVASITPSTISSGSSSSAQRQCQGVILAALVGALQDRDATLRAKALGCLEKALPQLVETSLAVGWWPQATQSPPPLRSGFLQALCSRLCDRSASVRKKALQLLLALAAHDMPAGLHARVADAVLPVAAQLLAAKPDSPLHLGEAAQALTQVVLKLAACGASAAAVLSLLQLSSRVTDEGARAQLGSSVAGMLLPSEATPQQSLQRMTSVLGLCSSSLEVEQLRGVVQAALRLPSSGGSGRGRGSTKVAALCKLRNQALALCQAQLHAALQALPQGGTPLAALAQAAYVLLSWDGGMEALAPLVALLHLLLAAAAHAPGNAAATGVVAAPGVAAAVEWLFRALGCALHPAEPGSHSLAIQQDETGAALTGALLAAVEAALLSGMGPSVRQAAIRLLLSLPQPQPAAHQVLATLAAALSPGVGHGAPVSPILPLVLDPEGDQLQLAAAPAPPAAPALPAAGTGSSSSSRDACGSQQAQRSLLALVELLGAMPTFYLAQRAAFLQQLRQQAAGTGGGPLPQEQGASEQRAAGGGPRGRGAGDRGGAAALSPGDTHATQDMEVGERTEEGGTGLQGDLMQAEDEAQKQEAAAQRFLDSLLAAGDSAPACFLPLLEQLLEPGAAPEGVQVAALHSLGQLVVLSEPACRQHMAAVEHALLVGPPALQAAAVGVLARAIDSFPNSFSSKLPLVGALLAVSGEAGRERAEPGTHAEPGGQHGSGTAAAAAATAVSAEAGGLPEAAAAMGTGGVAAAAQVGEEEEEEYGGPEEAEQHSPGSSSVPSAGGERLQLQAAVAYARLLLSGKLKLGQGVLGVVGACLAHGAPAVATPLRRALAQLLEGAGPKGAARICLDLFHQTPLHLRSQAGQALADQLLSPADLRSDVLVGQALQTFITATADANSSGSSRGQRTAAAAAAAALLARMQPSARVLASLRSHLEGSSAGVLAHLHPAALQDLCTFVANHVPTAAAAPPVGAADSEGGGGAPAASAGAGRGAAAADAPKRKRGAGGTKGGSGAIQQELLQLLGCTSGGGEKQRRRSTAPAASAATMLTAATSAARSTRSVQQRSSSGGTLALNGTGTTGGWRSGASEQHSGAGTEQKSCAAVARLSELFEGL